MQYAFFALYARDLIVLLERHPAENGLISVCTGLFQTENGLISVANDIIQAVGD
jgi:hypothetical protein